LGSKVEPMPEGVPEFPRCGTIGSAMAALPPSASARLLLSLPRSTLGRLCHVTVHGGSPKGHAARIPRVPVYQRRAARCAL
jgi:hypothetical protein